MNTHVDKTHENKSQSVANGVTGKQHGGESAFEDNRPEAVAQRKLQEMVNNSPRAVQFRGIQENVNNNPQVKQTAQLKAIANNYAAQQQQAVQKKENNTGLPDNLKSGIENLSGYSMNDVRVHYNSDKPAQLQAHAYAQGTDIHIASGQEKYLPHEAWHVVQQQKQGRIKPTMQTGQTVQRKLKIAGGNTYTKEDELTEKVDDTSGIKSVLEHQETYVVKKEADIKNLAEGSEVNILIPKNTLWVNSIMTVSSMRSPLLGQG